jgi:hypothetical protein
MFNFKRNKIYVRGVRVEFTLHGMRIWAKNSEQNQRVYKYLVDEGFVRDRNLIDR